MEINPGRNLGVKAQNRLAVKIDNFPATLAGKPVTYIKPFVPLYLVEMAEGIGSM